MVLTPPLLLLMLTLPLSLLSPSCSISTTSSEPSVMLAIVLSVTDDRTLLRGLFCTLLLALSSPKDKSVEDAGDLGALLGLAPGCGIRVVERLAGDVADFGIAPSPLLLVPVLLLPTLKCSDLPSLLLGCVAFSELLLAAVSSKLRLLDELPPPLLLRLSCLVFAAGEGERIDKVGVCFGGVPAGAVDEAADDEMSTSCSESVAVSSSELAAVVSPPDEIEIDEISDSESFVFLLAALACVIFPIDRGGRSVGDAGVNSI